MELDLNNCNGHKIDCRRKKPAGRLSQRSSRAGSASATQGFGDREQEIRTDINLTQVQWTFTCLRLVEKVGDERLR